MKTTTSFYKKSHLINEADQFLEVVKNHSPARVHPKKLDLRWN